MLSFFPRDVLGEILDLIESVSEVFPTYFCYANIDLYSVCFCDFVHMFACFTRTCTVLSIQYARLSAVFNFDEGRT